MITINSAPILNSILLDANNTVISITSNNGVGYYFRAIILIDNIFFDEQSWSRKDDFTAEKDLKKLYNAYYETIFNPVFTNGLTQQNHLIKRVRLQIEERDINTDVVVQSVDLDDFYFMYNAKPISFNCDDKVQFLGLDPSVLQIPPNGKISIPFMVNSYKENVLVQLIDNTGITSDYYNLLDVTGKIVYLYTFDLSTYFFGYSGILYLNLSITVGLSTISKTFRFLTFPKFQIKEILFLNNFGYWIPVYLDGQLSIENNLDVKVYEELDATEKVYEINEKQNYTINTGALLTSEKDIVHQIVTALEAKIFLNSEFISMITATKKISQYKDRNNLYAENLAFSVKQNNSVPNQNLTSVVIPNSLAITNVVNTSGSNYDISFSSNFPLTNLFSEVSVDGITWSTPAHFSGLTSPQNRVISLGGFQYIRISDVNGSVTTYSNVYHYVVAFGIQEISNIFYNDSLGGFREADLNINVPNIASVGSLKWRATYNLQTAAYTDARVSFVANSGGFNAMLWYDFYETNGQTVGNHVTPIRTLYPSTGNLGGEYTSPINCQLRARNGHTIRLDIWLYDLSNNLISTSNYSIQ
jgi:hypothetical protein